MRLHTPRLCPDVRRSLPETIRAIGAWVAGALAIAGVSACAAPHAVPDAPGTAGWAQPGPGADGEPPSPPPGVSMRPPAATMPSRAGRLVDFQGTVWLFDVARGRWEEALRNRALTGGDRLSTGADGRAELRIGSTELRLGPRTELEFIEADDDRLVWRLATGSLAWRVRRHEIARESELRAGAVRVRAQGPGHYRVDVDDATVWASAWRGSLRVDSGDQLVPVEAGGRAEFMRPGPGPATVVTWSAPLRDAFSDWVARDEVSDAQQASASAAYVSPEMTGIEDLDRHGRWERHPEFGMVWMPLVVAAGWEPFRHGRWVWHLRWGWTWVDAAPWGFAPFHYGRWARWGGRWCWVPGPYVARPAFSPALVAWVGPSGPGVSVGATLHGRYWAPLPPRYRHPLPPAQHVHPHPPARHVHPHPPARQVHPLPPARQVHPLPPPRQADPPAPPRHVPAAPPPGEHQEDPRRRRPEPHARAPVPAERSQPRPPGQAVPAVPAAPPEIADRPRRIEPAQEQPSRARTPEAMRDRPRERQQTL